MINLNIFPVKFSNDDLLNKIVSKLTIALNSEVNIVNLSIDIEKYYSEDRRQYFSTQILGEVISLTSDNTDYFLILTGIDLYVPVLTFIFGEAQLKGKYSIVSVRRLHEQFYTGISNDKLLFERTIKEILHELGHNFGLLHCVDWDCVMHVSNSVEEVDIKGSFYCKSCFDSIKFI